MKRFLAAFFVLTLFIMASSGQVQAKPPFAKEREQAVSSLDSAQQSFKALNPTLVYLSQSQEDKCVKGRINIKENDPYKASCLYRVTYYYGFKNPLGDSLQAMDKRLRQSGWQTGETWGKNECILNTRSLSSKVNDWGVNGEKFLENRYDMPSYCHAGQKLGLFFGLVSQASYKSELESCKQLYIDVKPYSDEIGPSYVNNCLDPNRMRYANAAPFYEAKHKDFTDRQTLYNQAFSSQDYVASITMEKTYVYKRHWEIPVIGDWVEILFADGYHWF